MAYLYKHIRKDTDEVFYVGLSPKGGNYKRCHKLKKEYFGVV